MKELQLQNITTANYYLYFSQNIRVIVALKALVKKINAYEVLWKLNTEVKRFVL